MVGETLVLFHSPLVVNSMESTEIVPLQAGAVRRTTTWRHRLQSRAHRT
jgi:hypothetical protein